MIRVFVAGKPAVQGSKRYVGRGIMLDADKRLPAWRTSIRAAIIDEAGYPVRSLDGPVAIDLEFILVRPESAPKRRTPSAVKKPDIDKLVRAVLDAVTLSGAWRDDSQVVQMTAKKRLAELGETPGCWIAIGGIE